MGVGLSTYCFFWRASDRVTSPMGLPQMLEQCAEMEVKLFQICDFEAVTRMTDAELVALRKQAEGYGIELELGTKGVSAEVLDRYLHIGRQLNVRLLRSMFNSPTHRPTTQEAEALLRRALPEFEASNIRLCLETYEQVSSQTMMSVIDSINSPWLGICLDPANCVAALEQPRDVINNTADRVLNLHVKDFHFTRQAGWVGFNLVGCPLGEGLLDYDYMVEKVRPQERGINQIVEHWLPWETNAVTTCRLENQWTRHSLNYIRNRL
ncbi:sugar phosphate isomerase [Leminorella grimontii]|uniref:Sugar phosphate isomerase n=1 Tax=Leminorella grimontii TaxID=82981 RepID=A0AAV5MX32_9GAMM|nr:TIM barrel protein [Leminorella grimontii]KFC96415.1 hypothetical protein GLGR_1591 [Leminorella grimontii ATCC 33999 = DSM 5078]GKX54396.1 sugar phosphate isomerase [Leminorella grimontii]VFS59408.1 putative L-xylulose 5-phosphate 3-epimerase [Leminorella grimontii]